MQQHSKVYSHLGPYTMRKRRGDPMAIVVAGCVAQQEAEKLLLRVPEIDLVLGPQYANRIGDLLVDVMNGNQIVATEPIHIMEDVTKPRRDSKVTAWVNIIFGCNEHCTYCVVPATRGVEQSRTKESIVEEVEGLVRDGYREVTLLGQNIDAWGRDMSPKQKFADLLKLVSNVPGLARLRFATSHPRYMSPRVIRAVKENPVCAPVFHVPFQSGDNDILQVGCRNYIYCYVDFYVGFFINQAMRRGYTQEKYMSIVQQIRDEFGEDAAITSGSSFHSFPQDSSFSSALWSRHYCRLSWRDGRAVSTDNGCPSKSATPKFLQLTPFNLLCLLFYRSSLMRA